MKSIAPSKCLAIILAFLLALSAGSPTAFSATTNKDFKLDDNDVDSPRVIMRDEEEYTFTLQKLDAGGADIVNNEGAINFKPSNDTDDYLSGATVSDASYLYWLGILTYTNDPGLRVDPATGKLEYRDQDSASWEAFADISATAENAANKQLSNLDDGNVAVNTSLISDTANTDDLGSEALYWKKLYLSKEISFEGDTDNDFQTTFTITDPTADRTITFKDESGTVAYTSDVSAVVANKQLSNLDDGNVAVNTSLISDTANTDDLGSEALYWKKLYLADQISFEGATDNDFQTTFSVTEPTADSTVTFPNDTGTVLLNVVEDTTPQLGGMLDVNGNAIGDGTLELLKFTETASAVNELTITNAATGDARSCRRQAVTPI